MNKEARASLQKAHRKLDDALNLDTEEFAGLVIESSYYAMHHAAVAVLQDAEGSARVKLSHVIIDFAKYLERLHPTRMDLGEALNRAFDARVQEDYDTMDEADSEEAREILAQAEEFVDFCEQILDGKSRQQSFLAPNG